MERKRVLMEDKEKERRKVMERQKREQQKYAEE